ncbi:MAG: CDP-alcohol phosphatidyltransferase family protein [Sporichthyaceae bacterium]|nr:CDP-alcohol phosphatidyltransferase family protein [Sporichthyaceae bacterium]
MLEPPDRTRARPRLPIRSIRIDPDSRAATNVLLAGLRQARWRGPGWRRFVGAAAARSTQQVINHPRAVAELTVLHGAVAAAAGRRGGAWLTSSWLLCMTHLGLLGERSSIGPATGVTLVRANLPAVAARRGRWLAPLAVFTDLADGWLARRLDSETMFGGYADSLADAAFWTWYALVHEPDRRVRAAAIAASLGPAVVVALGSVAGGRMVESPRSALLRPAAAMQVVLAARAVLPRYASRVVSER